MTTDSKAFGISLPASADLSSYQYYAVKQNVSGKIAVCSSAGEKALGILQDKPAAADRACSVMTYGVSKAVAGGDIAYWNPVGPDASGKLVVVDEADEAVLGRSLEAATTNQVFQVLLTHEGSAAAVQDVDAFVSSADYTTTGQYLAVKPHTVAGQIVKIAAAADDVLGILQNAPDSGEVALVKTHGPCTATAGSGGVSAGDLLAVDSAGKLVTTTSGPAVGWALAAILQDATGLVFLAPNWMIDMTGSTLADGKIFVGSAGGVAAAVDMSGDATIVNSGAVTIANKKVTAAKMYAAAQGTILRGEAANVVGELDAKTSGQILVGDGTDIVSVAVSGDATLAASGALTIANASIEEPMIYPGFTEDFAEGLSKGLANLKVDGSAYDATAGVLNVIHYGKHKLGAVPIVGQTIPPAASANGLDIQGDQIDNDGFEIISNILGLSGHRPFIIGTDPAFYFECTFQIAAVNGTDEFHIGFRRAETVNGTWDNYLDAVGLGCNTAAVPMAIKIETILNNGATTSTDTTETLANGVSVKFKILVSAAGVVTYEIDDLAPSVTAAFTFDDGDPVIPYLHFLQANAAQTGAFDIEKWDVGYQ